MPKRMTKGRAIVLETMAYYLTGEAIGYFGRMMDKIYEGNLGPLTAVERTQLWQALADKAAERAAIVRKESDA